MRNGVMLTHAAPSCVSTSSPAGSRGAQRLDVVPPVQEGHGVPALAAGRGVDLFLGHLAAHDSILSAAPLLRFSPARDETNRAVINQTVDNPPTAAYLVVNQLVENKEGCVGG